MLSYIFYFKICFIKIQCNYVSCSCQKTYVSTLIFDLKIKNLLNIKEFFNKISIWRFSVKFNILKFPFLYKNVKALLLGSKITSLCSPVLMFNNAIIIWWYFTIIKKVQFFLLRKDFTFNTTGRITSCCKTS